MRSPLVSIGVAIYNVEQFLPRCLDSLIGQTFKDIELILVDDGSTDKSGLICDDYAKTDSRVVVIHKDNGGLASARQAALDIAKGRYFCVCDADDWVDSRIYGLLYEAAERTMADIVSCDYYINYPDGEQIEKTIDLIFEERRDLLQEIMKGTLPHMVWNKLFRRDLFVNNDISWEEGINLGEDFLISLKVFRLPVKIIHVPVCLYHYRRVMGGSSYTNSVSLSSFNQSFAIRQWVDRNLDLQKYAEGVFRLWVSLAFTGLRVKDKMPKEFYKKEVLQRISYIDFLKYRQFDLKSMLIFATKLLGYNCGKAICDKYYYKYYKKS